MNGNVSDSESFRRLLRRSVALPLLFALTLGVILLVEVVYLLSFQGWVERTDAVLKQSYELERLLVDRQTGLRGFVITRDEQFLEPYIAANPEIAPAIEGL